MLVTFFIAVNNQLRVIWGGLWFEVIWSIVAGSAWRHSTRPLVPLHPPSGVRRWMLSRLAPFTGSGPGLWMLLTFKLGLPSSISLLWKFLHKCGRNCVSLAILGSLKLTVTTVIWLPWWRWEAVSHGRTSWEEHVVGRAADTCQQQMRRAEPGPGLLQGRRPSDLDSLCQTLPSKSAIFNQ